MQIRREEVRTGLLVIVSIGILTGVLLAIGMPGVFKSTNTYRIYFDNAEALNPGAPVLLAGRHIGQVTNLVSPVPLSDRPAGHENCEVLVEVEVDRSAQIYYKVDVQMLQTSLLGTPVIDFTGGDPTSGLAPSNTYFVGVRQKDFTAAISDAVELIKDTVMPVAAQAQKTMQELSNTADNLRQLTAPGSNVDQAVTQFRKFGDNLVQISAKGNALQNSLVNIQTLTGTSGHLYEALANVDHLTDQILAQDRVGKTLDNLQDTTQNLNEMLEQLSPRVDVITLNLEQATDTLKRQPWRLVWPTTKKYPSPGPIRN
ncbi:MAG: MlaD family protein [Chthoniobacteraceae bacterium]|jgi:ABC-type transporter Mla subunit MlaD